jgi:plasmid stability protein
MAQDIVRNIEIEVKTKLKLRAAQHGWSTEEEVRQILHSAVRMTKLPQTKLGSRIAKRFSCVGLVEHASRSFSGVLTPLS